MDKIIRLCDNFDCWNIVERRSNAIRKNVFCSKQCHDKWMLGRQNIFTKGRKSFISLWFSVYALCYSVSQEILMKNIH